MMTLWFRFLGTAMAEMTADCGALAEVVVFLKKFNEVQRGKVTYPL